MPYTAFYFSKIFLVHFILPKNRFERYSLPSWSTCTMGIRLQLCYILYIFQKRTIQLKQLPSLLPLSCIFLACQILFVYKSFQLLQLTLLLLVHMQSTYFHAIVLVVNTYSPRYRVLLGKHYILPLDSNATAKWVPVAKQIALFYWILQWLRYRVKRKEQKLEEWREATIGE